MCPWTDHILARNPLLEVEIFLEISKEAISPLFFTHIFVERRIEIRILNEEFLPTDSAWWAQSTLA